MIKQPRFSDIPQYTRDGHHTTTVTMDHLLYHVDRWVTNYGLELNPDFQRGHVWDEPRQIAFVEHLLRGGVGSNEIRFNHTEWMRSFEGDFVLVDGLQRLTACMKFLQNKITAFGYLYYKYQDSPSISVSLTFRVNDLRTRAEVLNWYLELNSGGVAHTQAELDLVRDLLEAEKEES